MSDITVIAPDTISTTADIANQDSVLLVVGGTLRRIGRTAAITALGGITGTAITAPADNYVEYDLSTFQYNGDVLKYEDYTTAPGISSIGTDGVDGLAFSKYGDRAFITRSEFDSNYFGIYVVPLDVPWEFGSVGASKQLLTPDFEFVGFTEKGVHYIDFNQDHSKMYALVNSWTIVTFNMPEPDDVLNATRGAQEFKPFADSSNSVNTVKSFWLADNDTRLFVLSLNPGQITEYTLSTPGDISTATPAGKTYSPTQALTTESNGRMNPNGTQMYLGHGIGVGYQLYTLSTPYDVTTATPTGSPVILTADEGGASIESRYELYIREDGMKAYARPASAGVADASLRSAFFAFDLTPVLTAE